MKLNPVFKNEIKLSSRTMKSSWMVFGYNAVLIVASMMVLYSMMDTVHYGYSMDYSEMVGLYVVMAYMEFGMILLIIPAITAGSIAGERDDTLVAQTGNAGESTPEPTPQPEE